MRETGHKSTFYILLIRFCVLAQTIFSLGQSEANSEKRQKQADHCCVGYHPRNKHWPVSLNDDEKDADDDVVSFPTR